MKLQASLVLFALLVSLIAAQSSLARIIHLPLVLYILLPTSNDSASNADAPTFSPEHNATVISKPHEETQQFDDFFTYIIQQETDPAFPLDSEVRYAQTRENETAPLRL
jgi:hypothetical protein